MMRRKSRHKKNILCVSSVRRSNEQFGKLIAILALTLISCGVVGYGVHVGLQSFLRGAVFENPDFNVKNIEIHVNGEMPEGEVLKYSGITKGQNIFSLDMNGVRRQILAVPSISNVTIERRLPDTIRIVVDERQPVAILQPKSQAGYKLAQSIYYIDAQGVVMKPKPGERLKQLPVITGILADYVVEGVAIRQADVMSALNFIRISELSGVRGELDLGQIDVAMKGYLVIRTQNRGLIRFRTEYLGQQLKRLEVVLDSARYEQKTVRTVDLSPERNVPVTYF